jgi:hypothetical protein
MSDETSEEKKVERYNTQYLVSNIQKDQGRTRTVGYAVAGVMVVLIIYFVFVRTPAKDGAPIAEAPPPASMPAR